LRIHLHRPEAPYVTATKIATGGKKTAENKTIYKSFVRRKRTKKMTKFRPLELDEDQVAADTSARR